MMDIWVVLTYGLFMTAILWGEVACWISSLPLPQKFFWAVVILIFPIAGTACYFLVADDSRTQMT